MIREVSFIHPMIPPGGMKDTADSLNRFLAAITRKKGVPVPAILPLRRSKVSAQLAIEDLPEGVRAGGSFSIPVIISNNRPETLRSFQPNPVLLSHHWKDRTGEIIQFEGLRTAIKPLVLPGTSMRVHMLIQIPEKPGEYNLEITLVQEGVFWFEKVLKHFPYTISCTVV
jgi:hypothetical protein